MKVGVYIRVSTKEQAEGGYSIGEQTERLKSYCLAKDWIIHRVYTDPGYSGSNLNRPGMKELQHDIDKGDLDLVLVYKLDRLSRSQKDTLFLIEDVFLKNNVDFVSMSENFDTTTPFGRAMIGILSVFAQLEREQITERMSMGRVARAKEGYFHGGGYPPLGYDYVDGELIINDYEAMQVRQAFKMFVDGVPNTQIMTYMNERYTNKYSSWTSDTTLSNILARSVYIGKVTWDGVEYDGRHEPIIETEMFEAAQKLIAERKGNRKPFVAKHLLTGLLYCGNCTARYSVRDNYNGSVNRKYHPYYTCYSRSKLNKNMIVDPTCRNHNYPVNQLNQIIKDQVKQLHFDPSLIDDIINSNVDDEQSRNEENKATIRTRLARIASETSKLLDLYQTSELPVDLLSERVSALNEEKEKLESELKNMEDAVPTITKDKAVVLLDNAAEILDGDDTKAQRMLIHSLIDKIIIVNDEDIEIHWSFV